MAYGFLITKFFQSSVYILLNKERLLWSIGVWLFITPSVFWGKTVWWLCVCDGPRGSQYVYTMLPRSKLMRCMVCVERQGMNTEGCVLCRYWCLR